jgi:two-component system cell cycle sensor histidine kinase/response regulator CckA
MSRCSPAWGFAPTRDRIGPDGVSSLDVAWARATTLVLVDSDDARRGALAESLRRRGHPLTELATIDGLDALPGADIAILAGTGLLGDCVRYRESGQVRWIVAIGEADRVEAAIAVGADDALIVSAQSVAGDLAVDLGLRLRIARHGGVTRRAEAGLRSVLHASPDGIIVHRDSRFVYVNPAAVRQLGIVDADAVLGRSIYDYLLPGEVAGVRERIEGMWREGQPTSPRDFQFQRPDGQVHLGEVVSVLAGFEGEPAVITIIRDVGEQRALQSRMLLADRLATVGTLAVGVAHEINNPLSWVVGNLGLLADEFDNQVRMREQPGHDPVVVASSRARVRELLGRAQEGTERVRRIVRDLVRFGRSDEGEGQPVDVHALLDSAIEIADVQLRHRAQLARDYRSSGYVRASEARLGQVFLNLLVNAAQAIAPGAPRQNQVRVATHDLEDGRIEVAITDTGSGMPEHVRKRIFEPFFTTKPVGEGTGIGLAISNEIVTSFGGEIVVESEIGRGTTFRVRLRQASDDPPSHAAQVMQDDSDQRTRMSSGTSSGMRVLIVDDEPLIREMVCDALSQHEVTAVSNGREALAEILDKDWDLVLCDMILPELSGLDLYRELEQRRPAVLDKLVFMTGGEFSRQGPRLPNGARVRRLEKPFSIKTLRELVRDARG